jgi:Xaa-Pro aminopeptidase
VVLPGEPVCAISETVLITQDGNEVLTRFEPRNLVVV